MKFASEVMLLKAMEIYVDLSICYQETGAKIVVLENQKSLVEADYEACLWKNDVPHAQLATKSKQCCIRISVMLYC